jgi:hypothetical protein
MSYTKLIARFINVWGEPKVSDPEQFLSEYERILAGCSAQVLEKIGDMAIDSETYWPRPADVRKHRDKAIYWTSPPKTHRPAEHQEFTPRASDTPVDPEMAARVQALVNEFKQQMAARRLATEEAKPQLDWARTQRPGFEEMQANSPNGIHRERR